MVVTALAIAGYVHPTWPTDFFRKPAGQLESNRNGIRIRTELPDVEQFSTRGDAVLVMQSEQLFTPRGAAALRSVADALESKAYVKRVLWMDRIPMLNIFGLPEPLFPHATASEKQYEAAREKALKHPFIGGQLLSSDANTMLMTISIDGLFLESDEDCIEGLKQIATNAAADYPDVEMSFSVTGLAAGSTSRP